MANKKQLEDLLAQKLAAGLSPTDAAECAQRQLDHDDKIAAEAEAAEAAAKKSGKKPVKKDDESSKTDSAPSA